VTEAEAIELLARWVRELRWRNTLLRVQGARCVQAHRRLRAEFAQELRDQAQQLEAHARRVER
jgi:MFS superfamily sulfate permease-like transporter